MHRPLPSVASIRVVLLAAGVALAGACSAPPPPPPAPQMRPATTVAAPITRTFDAALEIMRQDGAQIDEQDRGTGTISTKELIIPYRYRGVASDCGAGSDQASQVVMTLRVTGDEQRSAVQVSGSYFLRGIGMIRHCTTKNFWEANIEERIRERAEGR